MTAARDHTPAQTASQLGFSQVFHVPEAVEGVQAAQQQPGHADGGRWHALPSAQG